MNIVTTLNSVELAEAICVRHDNLMRDIKKLVGELDATFQSSFTLSSYSLADGRIFPMYLLDQDGIMCIIGGYDANSRMLMIKYVFSFIVTKEL